MKGSFQPQKTLSHWSEPFSAPVISPVCNHLHDLSSSNFLSPVAVIHDTLPVGSLQSVPPGALSGAWGVAGEGEGPGGAAGLEGDVGVHVLHGEGGDGDGCAKSNLHLACGPLQGQALAGGASGHQDRLQRGCEWLLNSKAASLDGPWAKGGNAANR